jgi:hypothetical protein
MVALTQGELFEVIGILLGLWVVLQVLEAIWAFAQEKRHHGQ